MIAAFRDADWLDATRVTRVRTALVVLLPLLALGWLLRSAGGQDEAGHVIGTDYLSFWTAARFAVGGAPEAAYDTTRHHAAQLAAFGRDPGYVAFFYPPAFLLVLLPFGMLGYFASLAAWLAATGYGYWRAVKAWGGSLAALLAFPAVLINAGHGQNGFLTTALFGGGALLVGKRPWLGGALLGALVIKPHLAIVIPFALAFRGEWRAFVATGLSATALLLASYLVFGVETWRGFLDSAQLASATLEQGLVSSEKMQSLFAAVRTLGGPLPLAYALQIALAVAAIAGVALVARSKANARAQAAVMAGAALLISPFLLDYDLTLAAFPLLWMLHEGQRTGFRPWEKSLLAAAFILPLVSRNIALATGVPLGPLVLSLFFLLVVRRARSEHRHAAVDVDRLPGDVGRLAA